MIISFSQISSASCSPLVSLFPLPPGNAPHSVRITTQHALQDPKVQKLVKSLLICLRNKAFLYKPNPDLVTTG